MTSVGDAVGAGRFLMLDSLGHLDIVPFDDVISVSRIRPRTTTPNVTYITV
jgi:hypothetical protein